MILAQLPAVLRELSKSDRIATHSAECWRWHWRCAMGFAADVIESRPRRTTSEDVRQGCCDGWPKPCSYHEGWMDALDAIDWEDQQATIEAQAKVIAAYRIARLTAREYDEDDDEPYEADHAAWLVHIAFDPSLADDPSRISVGKDDDA